jgi:hypothetical protein
VIDNVLLAFNYKTQETFVFDVKSPVYRIAPFVKVRHAMILNPTISSLIGFMPSYSAERDYVVTLTVLYDGVLFPPSGEEQAKPEASLIHEIDSESILNHAFKNIANEYQLDIIEGL